MKIFTKLLAAFACLLAFQVGASEESKPSLKAFMKPVHDITYDTKRAEGVIKPVCFGPFDRYGKPFVGTVNFELGTCEYLYKMTDSQLNPKKAYDSTHVEWLDIDPDVLFAWLAKKATKSEDKTTGNIYYAFTYEDLTGSASSVHHRDTYLCAQLVNKRELTFGYMMSTNQGEKTCVPSVRSSYVISTVANWEDEFYKVGAAWCANMHDGNFCTATEDGGSKSEEECAKSALAKSNTKGYCWDGGTCCHVNDILNTRDKDGGKNTCRLKKGVNKDKVMFGCKKLPLF